jgi:hypothetical protein
MKNIVLMIVSLALFSCNDGTVKIGPGSGKPVTGNGKVLIRERSVEEFNSLHLEGVFNVFIRQGQNVALEIETDENLQDMIVSEMKKGEFHIHMKDSITLGKRTKMNVFVTVKNLKKLKTECVGNVKTLTVLKLDALEMKCNSVGGTTLMIDANRFDLTANIVGGMTISGSVKEAEINHNGVGAIKAGGLKAEKMTLKANGVGVAEVHADKELNITTSGIGAVRYSGDPAIKNLKNSGLGKISRAEIN